MPAFIVPVFSVIPGKVKRFKRTLEHTHDETGCMKNRLGAVMLG